MIRATREGGHQGQLEQQQSRESADYDTIEEAPGDKWFRVKVPDWQQEKDSYLRLGATPNPKYGEWDEKGAEREEDDEEAGWFDYTDGIHTSISGPTMDPAGTSKLEENPTRADRPSVDAAIWTRYDVKIPPPSPYNEYPLGKDFWNPNLKKDAIDTVIASKDTRYYPYWDEKTSKRQQYDADNNQWKYSYAVKRDDLIRGSHSEHVQGDRITEIEGTWDCAIKGHLYNTAWGHVHSDYYQSHSESYYGDVLDVYGQPSADVTVTEIAYGPKYEWHFGNKVEVVEGNIYEYHKGNKTEDVEGYMEETHLGGKKTTIENQAGFRFTEEVYENERKMTTEVFGEVESTYHDRVDEHRLGDINMQFILNTMFTFFLGLNYNTHVGGRIDLSPSIDMGISALKLETGGVNIATGLTEVHTKKASIHLKEFNAIF
ncbi:MAG: hypothetical protein GTO40_08640 [Deltaproteobacteria bacterium]|nr:hypothetical protein [Deltaproteobacteria bacterium]